MTANRVEWPDHGIATDSTHYRAPRTYVVDGEERKEQKRLQPGFYDAQGKRDWTRTYSPRGTILACPLGAEVLAAGAWPEYSERAAIICEGEPDFLTLASEGVGPRRIAIFGVFGASLRADDDITPALLCRIPYGSDVVVDTHNDPIRWPERPNERARVPAGDYYASIIKSTLRGRCIIRDAYGAERKARAAELERWEAQRQGNG